MLFILIAQATYKKRALNGALFFTVFPRGYFVRFKRPVWGYHLVPLRRGVSLFFF